MFRVTRYPMISKTESGRVGYRKKYRVAGRVRVPAGHWLQGAESWTGPLVTIQEQHSLGRDRHGRPHHCCLVLPGGRRCPCSKWRHFFIFAYIYPCAMGNDSTLRWTIGVVVRLSMAKLKDEGGEGRSAKGRRGHP